MRCHFSWPNLSKLTSSLRYVLRDRLETYKWGIHRFSNICDGRVIISAVSEPDRRTLVSFLQILVATDNYHTPHKYEFRKPKRWGPTWKPIPASVRIAEMPRYWFLPGTPTFRFSKLNFVWRVVVVNSASRWRNRTIFRRSGADAKTVILPAQIPTKHSMHHT